jgi:hypothetical protein
VPNFRASERSDANASELKIWKLVNVHEERHAFVRGERSFSIATTYRCETRGDPNNFAPAPLSRSRLFGLFAL